VAICAGAWKANQTLEGAKEASRFKNSSKLNAEDRKLRCVRNQRRLRLEGLCMASGLAVTLATVFLHSGQSARCSVIASNGFAETHPSTKAAMSSLVTCSGCSLFARFCARLCVLDNVSDRLCSRGSDTFSQSWHRYTDYYNRPLPGREVTVDHRPAVRPFRDGGRRA
jgi:hypothetical protein